MSYSLVYDIKIIPVVSLVYDVVLRFDQNLKHGIQDLRKLFLKDNKEIFSSFFLHNHNPKIDQI